MKRSTEDKQSAVSQYVLAVLAAVVALLIRQALWPVLGPTHPYFIFCLAVILSVWLWGTGPAIVTTLTGLIGIHVWLYPRMHVPLPRNIKVEISGTITFLLLTGFIIALGEAHRRTQETLKREIAERSRAEQALRENEERLRIAQRAGRSGTYERNFKTGRIFTSQELREVYGFFPAADGDEREQWRRRVHAEDIPKMDDAVSRALAAHDSECNVEFRFTHGDGSLRWVDAIAKIFYDEKGEPLRLVAVYTDITDRKQAKEALQKSHLELEQRVEERTQALAESLEALEREVEIRRSTENVLRQLSAGVLRLQDEERRRIARDLHDSIGQTLVALKMMLDALAKVVEQVPEAGELMRKLDSMAGQALQEIRVTSHLLHPPLLDEIGFASAAQWYVEGFASRSGIKTNLDLSDTPRLTRDEELVLFRILQEGLTNVLRHSGSSTVDIQLSSDKENAILSIKDYGRGIPADKVETFRRLGAGVGVGLGGMKQRVRILGGHLRVESDASGTCITATLPLAAVEPAAAEPSRVAVSGVKPAQAEASSVRTEPASVER